MPIPLSPGLLPPPVVGSDAIPLLPPTAYAPPALPLPPEPIESPLPLAARQVPPLPLPLPAPEPLLDLEPAPPPVAEPDEVPVTTPEVEPAGPAQPEVKPKPTVDERVEAALAGLSPERAAQLRPTIQRAVQGAQSQAKIAELTAMAARESEARLAPEREAFARAERAAADARQAAAHDLAAFRMEAVDRRREAGEQDFGDVIGSAIATFLTLAATARHGNFAETAQRAMQNAVERRARKRAQVDKEIATQEEALRARYDLAGEESDIASRRYELAKVLESDRLAADLRVALADVADREAQVMLETTGSEIRNQADAALAGLEAEAEAQRFKAAREAAKEEREEVKLRLDIEKQQHQEKMDRQRLHLERQRVKMAKEELSHKRVADEVKLANDRARLAIQQQELDDRVAKRSISLPQGGPAVQLFREKDAQEVSSQIAAGESMARRLDELADLEKKHGMEWFQSQEGQKTRSKYTDLVLNGKEYRKLGVIAGPDLPLLKDWLGQSPESTFWTQSGRFAEVRQQLEQGLTDLIQAKGAPDAVVDIPVEHGPAAEAAVSEEDAWRAVTQSHAPVSGQRTPVADRLSRIKIARDAVRVKDKSRDWFVKASESTVDALGKTRAQRAEWEADRAALKRSVPIAGSPAIRQRRDRLRELTASISDAQKIERALVKELEGDYKRALDVWRRLSDSERQYRTDLEDTLRRTSRATGKPMPGSPLRAIDRAKNRPVTGAELEPGETFIRRP